MSIQIFSVSKLQNFAGFSLYQSNMDDLVGWALVNQPTWKLQANNLTSDKKKTALLVSVCVSSHCLREEITGSPSWYWYKVIVANEYANHFKYSDWICTEKLVKALVKKKETIQMCVLHYMQCTCFILLYFHLHMCSERLTLRLCSI